MKIFGKKIISIKDKKSSLVVRTPGRILHDIPIAKKMLAELKGCSFRGDFINWLNEVLDLRVTGEVKTAMLQEAITFLEHNRTETKFIKMIKNGLDQVYRVNRENGNRQEKFTLAEIKRSEYIYRAEILEARADDSEKHGYISDAVYPLLEEVVLYRNAGELGKAAACSEHLGRVNLSLKRDSFAIKSYITASYTYADDHDYKNAARCSLKVAELPVKNPDNMTKKISYRFAAKYFKKAGEKGAAAKCLEKTAELALIQECYDEAVSLLKKTLEIYKELRDQEGEKKCQAWLETLEINEADPEKNEIPEKNLR